jgi:peptidyl-prolyl cis-trans isomerase A (cyclophilin A)
MGVQSMNCWSYLIRPALVLVWFSACTELTAQIPLATPTGNDKANPILVIKTEFGEITAELYADKAPTTVANFMGYITGKKVTNPTFYRVVRTEPDNQPNNDVKIQVLQGGLTDVPDRELPKIKHETTKETGVPHKDGVLSMARNEPGTATHHFSICIGDQPELDFGGKRNPDGQGFAAFGKVTKGMDVVKKIHGQPADGQYLRPRVKMLEVRVFGGLPVQR